MLEKKFIFHMDEIIEFIEIVPAWILELVDKQLEGYEYNKALAIYYID